MKTGQTNYDQEYYDGKTTAVSGSGFYTFITCQNMHVNMY